MRKLSSALLALGLGAGLFTPTAAQAGPTDHWEEFSLQQTTCSGETVTFEGAVNVRFSGTVSASGNVISGLHLNSVSGVAVSDSGEKYILRDGGKTTTKNAYLTGLNGASEWTSTIRLRLIQAGETTREDDLFFTALFHFTVNANGDTTVSFDNISGFDCR